MTKIARFPRGDRRRGEGGCFECWEAALQNRKGWDKIFSLDRFLEISMDLKVDISSEIFFIGMSELKRIETKKMDVRFFQTFYIFATSRRDSFSFSIVLRMIFKKSTFARRPALISNYYYMTVIQR